MSGRVVYSQAIQANGSVETELSLNLSSGGVSIEHQHRERQFEKEVDSAEVRILDCPRDLGKGKEQEIPLLKEVEFLI